MIGEPLVSDIYFSLFLPRCCENAVAAQPISTSLNVNISEKYIQNDFLPYWCAFSRFLFREVFWPYLTVYDNNIHQRDSNSIILRIL